MTTLHAGGKFDSKVYETSGGLHGVGISVVNALSDLLEVEVARDRKLYRQVFAAGKPKGKLKEVGEVHNRRGTKSPLPPGSGRSSERAPVSIPDRLLRMARSKAYLFGGVEIRWSCAPALIAPKSETPPKATFRFPGRAQGLPFRDAGRRDAGRQRSLRRQDGAPGRARLGRMGDRLVRRRRLHPLLLQHHSDSRRRHARGGAAKRAAARLQGLCRADRQQARRGDHVRRHHDVLRGDALRLHP